MAFDCKNTKQLFHGSANEIVGHIRPSNYDGVFWTAEHSTVAQNYIPSSGGTTRLRMSSYELDERVMPHQNNIAYAVALMMGCSARNIQYDQTGRAVSFGIPDGYPTNRMVAEFLAVNLGYKSSSGSDSYFEFDIKSNGWDQEAKQSKVTHADHKIPGNLLIVTGFRDMNLFDMSLGESDLTDLQYNRIATFRKLEESGYDGVIIDDFAQSKNRGNIGHRAIGFFGSACKRLEFERIPAVNFDWEEGNLGATETPEYAAFSRAKLALGVVDASSKKSLKLAHG